MRLSTFDAWVAHPKQKLNAQVRLCLFCFPYAGGGTSIFHGWSEELPPEIAIYPIQLPGREQRLMEPPFSRLASLVRALTQVLQPYMGIPFAFFGHSMGALIGFELARQLRKQSQTVPIHLFVSGNVAPQFHKPGPPISQWSNAMFVEELRRIHGTPEGILQDHELMQLMLPVLRADFAICETYTYIADTPLPCSISAFGGQQDDEVSQEQLAGWRKQTCASFELRMFPGDHFFLHSARKQLLAAMVEELTEFL